MCPEQLCGRLHGKSSRSSSFRADATCKVVARVVLGMRAPPFDHALITWGRSLRLVRVWLNRYQSSRYGATCRTWSFAPAVSRSNDPMYEECGDIKLTMVVGGWGTSPSGEHSWNVLCRLRAILALCVDWQRGGVTSRSILSIACAIKPSPQGRYRYPLWALLAS